jgi:hypothetical protein
MSYLIGLTGLNDLTKKQNLIGGINRLDDKNLKKMDVIALNNEKRRIENLNEINNVNFDVKEKKTILIDKLNKYKNTIDKTIIEKEKEEKKQSLMSQINKINKKGYLESLSVLELNYENRSIRNLTEIIEEINDPDLIKIIKDLRNKFDEIYKKKKDEQKQLEKEKNEKDLETNYEQITLNNDFRNKYKENMDISMGFINNYTASNNKYPFKFNEDIHSLFKEIPLDKNYYVTNYNADAVKKFPNKDYELSGTEFSRLWNLYYNELFFSNDKFYFYHKEDNKIYKIGNFFPMYNPDYNHMRNMPDKKTDFMFRDVDVIITNNNKTDIIKLDIKSYYSFLKDGDIIYKKKEQTPNGGGKRKSKKSHTIRKVRHNRRKNRKTIVKKRKN